MREIGIIVCCVAALSCAHQQDANPKPKAQSPAATAKTGTPAAQPKPAKPAVDPAFAALVWQSADAVKKACSKHLAAADQHRKKLLAVKGKRTVENTLVPFNEILIAVEQVQPRSELFANAHPNKSVRDAAEQCERDAKSFLTKLMLDRPVYDALVAVDVKAADPLTQRFAKHLLRDYRRSGVDRDEATRKKLAALKKQAVEVGQAFSKRIRKDKRAIEVSAAELKGMPADFMTAHKPDASGKIRITTDYPDFFPVQSYADSEKVRRDLYIAYLTRAYPDNQAELKRLLTLRHQYAKTLGYKSWADYNAGDKMVKTSKAIAKFIDKVAKLARPRMKADLRAVLKRKRKDVPGAKSVGVWDRFYYVKKIQAEQFGVKPTEVRPYFEFTRVKRGIMDLAQELFKVRFERVKNAAVWHASVEAYNVYDGKRLVGRFFLDLHPRKNKYGHAAEFPILSGIKGRQLPVASLVTNFTDPSKSKGPALMEHQQVGTFFHEFGHLVHQLLSGEKRWSSQAGISCEWDFVEAPSQILEEWTWDPKVLARFARHYKTDKPIPAALVERMRKAKEFGKGMHVMRQMFYAALSYQLHAKSPKKLNLMKKLKKIQRKYNPYPYTKGTAVFASFGHIEGYSSMYYTYMWSLVLAKDLFTRFAKEGLLNTSVSMDYRNKILGPGGTVDAADMVKNFLGRPYSFEAYRKWLSR